MEAVAKLLDDADVLSKAGLYDFHPNSEVYRIISKKDLPGGPFFTKALYENIEHIIRYQIAQRPEINNDPAQMIVIWRETAQREFDFIPGRDSDLDAKIQAELQKRGAPPKWSTTTRAELAKHAIAQLGDAAKVYLASRGVSPELAELVGPLAQSPELVQTLMDPEVRTLLNDPQNLRFLAAMLRQVVEQAKAARQAPPAEQAA